MTDFTIAERTDNFTLQEVLDFIDETNISKRDSHELKQMICDMVDGVKLETLETVLNIYINKNKKYHNDILEFQKFMKVVSEEMENYERL